MTGHGTLALLTDIDEFNYFPLLWLTAGNGDTFENSKTIFMAQNIFVKARNKETGTETVITYKAYLDIQSLLDLVGQSDEHGILIPGDPNLQPAHRRPAEKSGATVAEKALQDLKDAEKFARDNSPVRYTHQYFSSSSGVDQYGNPDKIPDNSGKVLVFDTESGSLEPIPDAIGTETPSNSDTSNPVTESDKFHVEQPVSVPVKERKKPGPKPKIKQNEV